MTPPTEELQKVERLERATRDAAKRMGLVEARYFVDLYHQQQELRKAMDNQIRAAKTAGEITEPLEWAAKRGRDTENQIKALLAAWSKGRELGRWCDSVTGIGPVIAAGLMTHIDITKAPTVGHIWRFAGLDPTMKWEKKTKRPWNATLQTLCWKIGESFVKVAARENDVYGGLYLKRKAREIEANERGEFAGQAKVKLDTTKIGKDTEAYLWYAGCLTPELAAGLREMPAEKRGAALKKVAGKPGSGVPMLPPAHIHARAKRWAVKLFLAHYHHTAYRIEFGCEPPKPYVIEYLGHVHEIKPS